MSEHCDDDGKGGCVKHPPTMRLAAYNDQRGAPFLWYWIIDEACPGRQCSWPARMDYDRIWEESGAQAQSMARAYDVLLAPRANMKSIMRYIRRIRIAEKLRAKGKVTPGVTFKG